MIIDRKTCFRIGASAFVLYLAVIYWPEMAKFIGLIISAAMPLIIGCAVAYIVNILMSFYERHYFPKTTNKTIINMKRPVCMTGAFVSLIAVVFLIVRLIVPELTNCVMLLLDKAPSVFEKAVAIVEEWEILPEDIIEPLKTIDWKSRIGEILSMVTSGITSVMDVVVSAVSSIVSVIVTGLLSLIFSIYILSGKETLYRQFTGLINRYLPEKMGEKIKYVLSVLDYSFHKYFVGQCTEAVILGTLCSLGMWILGLPYASMIGALIAFTALIPVAGAYIGGGLGAFMIMTVSPIKAVIFIIYLVILQQIEGNLIYPKVVGSSLGLPAIWVLAAVTIGGGIMGIMGMVLGVPIASAAYRIIRDDINRSRVAEKGSEIVGKEEHPKEDLTENTDI